MLLVRQRLLLLLLILLQILAAEVVVVRRGLVAVVAWRRGRQRLGQAQRQMAAEAVSIPDHTLPLLHTALILATGIRRRRPLHAARPLQRQRRRRRGVRRRQTGRARARDARDARVGLLLVGGPLPVPHHILTVRSAAVVRVRFVGIVRVVVVRERPLLLLSLLTIQLVALFLLV